MTNTTTATRAEANALRGLLAAIYEVVLPPRAADYHDDEAFGRLQRERAIRVHCAVKVALGLESSAGTVQDIEVAAKVLRGDLTPLPYRAADDAEDAAAEVAAR